ncbi:hypothetical protein CL1_1068 [Thermococcus cleftensis]|uniref:Uncharacterized protein n=1 Tax=Thermococcus cleftensis (strain DSM 27260 / KACC 17922 / CL1) TaxID=163003 RepID=I3ZU87_THECF|nr:hypothetical protein [Thermococcus cleftensis]AFL95271.1 hypothetical protein CL1_1068 [Thermococcus cleftensis]
MENSELIKILQLLAKAESEKPKLDDELINKVIEKVLSEYRPRVAVGRDGQLTISIPGNNVLSSLKELGLDTNEQKRYLNAAMKKTLKVLGEMVFNEKEPESEIEKKIFETLNVPDLRVKAKLKRAYTLPVVDAIEVHPAEISVDGAELKYYLLKIEHLKDKKPVAINFIMTRGDLMKLHNAIGEVLSDGDVTQGN